MAQPAVLTFSLLGITLLGLFLLGLIVAAWASFLDVHEHKPVKVRSVMLGILGAATLCELCLSYCGLTQAWVLVVVLGVNLWGWLDALLRFPVAHDLDSLFAAKQFVLLTVKTLSYAFGIVGFRQHIGEFLMLALLNIWCLPILYLMALPFHPAQKAATDGRDVDLIVRLWQLGTCKRERQRCTRSCKAWLQRRLFAASQYSPMMKVALCAASPVYRRAFSRACCSVDRFLYLSPMWCSLWLRSKATCTGMHIVEQALRVWQKGTVAGLSSAGILFKSKSSTCSN